MQQCQDIAFNAQTNDVSILSDWDQRTRVENEAQWRDDPTTPDIHRLKTSVCSGFAVVIHMGGTLISRCEATNSGTADGAPGGSCCTQSDPRTKSRL